MLPVPPVVLLELEPLGLLGAVVVDEEDDEPPGTTTVSFSFVTVLLDGADGAGTTVVSFFSQALSTSAASMMTRYPLRFMSTPFSFSVVTKCTRVLASPVPQYPFISSWSRPTNP